MRRQCTPVDAENEAGLAGVGTEGSASRAERLARDEVPKPPGTGCPGGTVGP